MNISQYLLKKKFDISSSWNDWYFVAVLKQYLLNKFNSNNFYTNIYYFLLVCIYMN